MEKYGTFKRPFIVYRTNTEEAYKMTLQLCEYLIVQYQIETIYVESTNDINAIKVFESNKSLQEKYKDYFVTFAVETQKTDICYVLGGDGTVLWANFCYVKYPRPKFITFYVGNLGYLAVYDFKNYKEVIDEIYAMNDNYSLEKRNLANCKICAQEKDGSIQVKQELLALNEITIEKGESLKMINIQLYMNNQPMTKIQCDGLIFATATGSSAYSLSAGGSLMHYEVDALILTAICPFSLSFRPLIIPRSIVMKVFPIKGCDLPIITKDGNCREPLKENEYVEIQLCELTVDFIILHKFIPDRIQLWKEKVIRSLGWNNTFQHN